MPPLSPPPPLGDAQVTRHKAISCDVRWMAERALSLSRRASVFLFGGGKTIGCGSANSHTHSLFFLRLRSPRSSPATLPHSLAMLALRSTPVARASVAPRAAAPRAPALRRAASPAPRPRGLRASVVVRAGTDTAAGQ